MRCPRCQAEQPLWAQYCMQCGAPQFRVPAAPAPAEVPVPEGPGPAPVPAPPAVPAKDYRPYITAGYLVALAATLIIPPLLGAVAMWLGWLAYRHGQGDQRRQGLWVMAAGLAAGVVGTGIALWVDATDLLA